MPEKIQALSSARFGLAEFKRNLFLVRPAAGTSKEDILNPVYWAHTAAHLKVHDVIEVCAEDGAYWGQLLVLSRSDVHANVVELTWTDIAANAGAEEEIGGLRVKYGNYKTGWRVLRVSDGEVVSTGLESREEAVAAAKAHAEMLA